MAAEKVVSAFERRVHDAEEEIHRLPRERVYIFDLDGSLVFQADGHETAVFIPDSIAHGRLVLHNHPNDTSFSRANVRLLLTTAAAELRVVTNRYRYRLFFPEGFRWSEIEPTINEIYLDELEMIADRVRADDLTADEGASQHLHRVWTRVSQRFGWNYRREDLDP